MTCIVGIRQGKTVWLGSDSMGSTGRTGVPYSHPKVFHSQDSKDIVIGYTSSFRMGQLLMYATNLFDELSLSKSGIDHRYLVTKFIPNLQNLFSAGGYEEVKNGVKDGGFFLLGCKDSLYKVQGDYSIVESIYDYDATGSGEFFALGSLASTEKLDLSPVERIHMALQAASKFEIHVGPPYYIVNTENEEVVMFEK